MLSRLRVLAVSGAALLAMIAGAASAQEILPRPEKPTQFNGRTAKDSPTPQWPKPIEAPKGAPNVLLILTDDVGFGASSAFGGPIPTPTFEALAKTGLRYTQFHVAAMCSPTRAALLTGRNHHEVGSGHVTDSVNAFEGYTSIVPRSAATIAEILKGNGYATGLFGKWHLTPEWETSQAGPFDHWPTGMGFQRFYGFLGGDTNQFAPSLYDGTRPIEPPYNDPSYHLESDLADHAIAWIREQKSLAPNRPFFMHYATGAAHAPHSAPQEWLDRFRGKFDQGWDAVRENTLARQKALGVVPQDTRLTQRPDLIPAWESLSADQKLVYARLMEAFAASLAYSDAQIGRVIAALAEMGQLDNTLVIFIQGDNGSSGEGGIDGRLAEASFMNGIDEKTAQIKARIDDIGGPRAYNIYPIGWAHAMDAPFQWFKQLASHFGATRDGMVVSWPARIKEKGGIRTQFHHVIDIAPTLLDLIGIPAPELVNGVRQQPISGVSMAYSLDDAKAASTRRTQYFELFGHRAIYHDGWVAATEPYEMPWQISMASKTIDDIKWQLYHVAEDFSESVDLAAQNPVKLRELQDLFWAEAARNKVLPILLGKAAPGPATPTLAAGRSSFVYYSGTTRIPLRSAPNFIGRSFDIEVDATVPAGPASGMLLTDGGRFGGLALYLLEGRLVFHYSLVDLAHYGVASTAPVPAGRHKLAVAFAYDGGGFGKGGTATLLVDGKPVGGGRIERTTPFTIGYGETLDVGRDAGTSVSDEYRVPFVFPGEIAKATVTLK